MTLPPVVIEVPASDASSPHIAALVESCTEAVSDGECRIGALEGVTPRAVAIVSWEADRTRARIEIGVRRDSGSQWLTRDVEFREADPESERWRSVGLMIGTLVGKSERDPDTVQSPRTPATRPLVQRGAERTPRAVAADVSQPKRVWLGLEALTGPGLDEGSLRYGVGVVGVWDTPLTPVLASASVRYFERPQDENGVVVHWLSVAVGGGVHARPVGTLRLESRVEVAIERVEAAIEAEANDRGDHWTPGLHLSVAGGVEPTSGLLLMAGAELDAFPRGTQIVLRGQDAGRALPLTWTAQVGVRVGF